MEKNRIEVSAKTVEAAIEKALLELNASREEVDIEIIEKGGKGFLGFGEKDAKVAVSLKKVEEVNVNDEIEVFAGENEEEVSEDVEASAQVAIDFLKSIFTNMKLSVQFEVELYEEEVVISISGENVGVAIGRRGETLDSIQYLTNLAVCRAVENNSRIIVDIEHYREKREETLKKLAERIANKVIKTGNAVTLEPMNAYERRIIHYSLQDNELVTTYSIGEEPFDRKVVIESK